MRVETVLAEFNDPASRPTADTNWTWWSRLTRVTPYVDGQERVSWPRPVGQSPISGGLVGFMVKGGAAEFQELEHRQFTGQRREIGLGLYDYGARRYDPYLYDMILIWD
ncbi:MAG: hypothetical protein CVU38_11705 [Chloroflexi bacterium HGW-Chloroflexi-1]|nr:MAG: hypothetical protein CVU38_11705 [Chloroflexi bacterium HGW-Chloroflexi-1]